MLLDRVQRGYAIDLCVGSGEQVKRGGLGAIGDRCLSLVLEPRQQFVGDPLREHGSRIRRGPVSAGISSSTRAVKTLGKFDLVASYKLNAIAADGVLWHDQTINHPMPGPGQLSTQVKCAV